MTCHLLFRFDSDLPKYKVSVSECVSEWKTRLYERPPTDDPHYMSFDQFEADVHEPVLKSMVESAAEVNINLYFWIVRILKLCFIFVFSFHHCQPRCRPKVPTTNIQMVIRSWSLEVSKSSPKIHSDFWFIYLQILRQTIAWSTEASKNFQAAGRTCTLLLSDKQVHKS